MVAVKNAALILATSLPLIGLAAAGGLQDIDHVVLFMQENRAFDHYFGTMAGVRGFADPNIHYNGKQPGWKQLVNSSLTDDVDYMTPWYLNYQGGDAKEATQCMTSGTNSWSANHLALNGGTNDHWAANNTPYSIGYYKREDLPIHFSLAEEWLVADMYQESVVAATCPNRVTWVSGSINVPGSPQTKDQGGYPYIDNNLSPGCDSDGINCYPLKWKTTAEHYEDAGVSWRVYQNEDNFDDNALAYFDQFQQAEEGSPLSEKGVKGRSLETFYAQAANGSLPEVSFIVAPTELSEHPPHAPHDGAWLQRKVAEAVINSPKYAKTALIVSYDETGGWYDHVNPHHSPNGTDGEWIDDPYGESGYTFAGPGFRVPLYIVSPWTRRGGVFVEHADHNSQILFLEKWQAAKGRDVQTGEMGPWRRGAMSDLVSAFDFENPDYSLPSIPKGAAPHVDGSGTYDGSSHCASLYGDGKPDVPYRNEDLGTVRGWAEQGFKQVRGVLTEGRTLVVEADGKAWSAASNASSGDSLALSPATDKHDGAAQRFVIHVVELGNTDFTVSSAASGLYLCDAWKLCDDSDSAVVLQSAFDASSGHSFKVKGTDSYVGVGQDGGLTEGEKQSWQVFSVTY